MQNNITMNDKPNPLQRFLTLLNGVKRSRDGYMALCPTHDDHNPSLSLSLSKEGNVLLHCFAGCQTEAILSSLGLKMSDLFPEKDSYFRVKDQLTLTVDKLAQSKNIPIDFLKAMEVEQVSAGVRITYRLIDGSFAPRQRLRTATSAKDGSSWLKGNGLLVPYGLWLVGKWANLSDYLVIVEGESDCWSLWIHDIAGLGIPGATLTNLLEAEYINKFPKLYIYQEPDQGGEIFCSGIIKRLNELGWSGKAFTFTLNDFKDFNELQQKTPDLFEQRFLDALNQAKPISEYFGYIDHDIWDEIIPFEKKFSPPFPMDALPDWMKRFVESVSNFTQTPNDLAAMLCLAATATALAKKAKIQVVPGYTEPLNLWTVVILPPANRKSAVLSKVNEPLYEHEKELTEQTLPLYRKAKDQYDIQQQVLEQAKRQMASAKNIEQKNEFRSKITQLQEELDSITIPSVPRIIASDITTERLTQLMSENHGRLAIISAEGEIFKLMSGRYSKTGSTNFETYNKAWTGEEPTRDDRVSRKGSYVANPALTLGLTIQPIILKGLVVTTQVNWRKWVTAEGGVQEKYS